MRWYVYLIVILILSACQTNQSNKPNHVESSTHIVGLIGVTNLQPGMNEIPLQDFFLDPGRIDSLHISGARFYKWLEKQEKLEIEAGDGAPSLLEGTFWIAEEAYTILFRKPRKIIHEMIFDPEGQNYTSVRMKGSMNDWNPANAIFKLIDGVWKYTFQMNPGKYHYLFVVDGKEMLDPANPVKEDNNIGGFNSVLYVNGAEGDLPHIVASNTSSNRFTFDVQVPGTILVLWNNQMVDRFNANKTGELSFAIPEEAKAEKRSWIRLFCFNEYGVGNDLLIPLENGQPVQNMAQITREDKESGVLYFLMVDRFNNGDSSNDKKVDDAEVHEKANYHGGDLAGVIQKLDDGYFEELGIRTIWLSPIVQNTWGAFYEYPEPHRKFTGYHGYWPISFTQIDKRFGTDEELHSLVEKAHGKNINVILDFVSNHVHEEHPVFQEHPDWATVLNLSDGTKNIRLWDEQRLTTWFDTFLPSLDYTNDDVLDMVTDSAIYWLSEYEIDGFRHDATKHIPLRFWRTFTHKVKKYTDESGRRLYQIGETFGGRELIGSFVGAGMLEGQFDFNLYWDARSVFANDNESFEKLNASIHETFDYYGYNHKMGNITGNHDIPRFISFASKALAFDEDAQEAGWNRDIQVKDEVGYKKLQSLTAFTMTIPGVPVMYYGDEFGMPGAGDPDNRRPMQFENLSQMEEKTKTIAEKLIALRNSEMALVYGDFQEVKVSEDVYVYSRKYFDELVILVFNKSTEQKTIEFKIPAGRFVTNFGGNLEVADGIGRVKLSANSFELLTN